MTTNPGRIEPAPLIPLENRPQSCRTQGCSYQMVTPRAGGMYLLHRTHTGDQDIEIPEKKLHDPNYDIWGRDIKPKLEEYHRATDQPAARHPDAADS